MSHIMKPSQLTQDLGSILSFVLFPTFVVKCVYFDFDCVSVVKAV
jgi:hypothetical protein